MGERGGGRIELGRISCIRAAGSWRVRRARVMLLGPALSRSTSSAGSAAPVDGPTPALPGRVLAAVHSAKRLPSFG